MELLLLVTEALLGALYLTQKWYLYQEKKAGWWIGIIASVIAIPFYLHVGYELFMIVEAASFVLYIVGLLKEYDVYISERLVHVLTLLVVVYIYWSNPDDSSILELVSVFTILFAFSKLSTGARKSGWRLLIIAHVLVIGQFLQTGQYIFCFFQVISVWIAYLALLKIKKPTAACSGWVLKLMKVTYIGYCRNII